MKFLPLALAGIVAFCGCQRSHQHTLTVGMELDYPPFEMTDTGGRPTGISVELAHALGQHLGRPIKIENIPFDGLIPALKTGKIDLIISSMTATEERAKSIDFSDPYVKTGICLLVNKNSKVTGIADANAPGTRVAVKKGTTGHLYATEHLSNAELLVLDKDAACVMEVAQGKADAFIYDQLSIFQNWKRHQETTRPILEPIRTEFWAVGIRKGNDELRSQVNAFLKQFQATRGFDALGDKYLKDQKTTFAEMGVAFIF
jgi:polar amino acid transport system substrate-binding protein